jgi:hypothetical protein
VLVLGQRLVEVLLVKGWLIQGHKQASGDGHFC